MRRLLNKRELAVVIDLLNKAHPDAKAELNFKSAYELLVATILSAQCTDVRVNKITTELFKAANDAVSMLELGEEKLIEYIRSAGFFNSKAKNIIAASKIISEKYGGNVPSTMEELTALPGVGRKTANVVLSNAFGIPGIAVDTHVFRVSNRIGIVNEDNVEDTEMSLRKRLPIDSWSKMHHVLIFQGRRICKARKPDCANCPIDKYCLHKI